MHHGAGTSFDESADLFVLARLPIVVVSAGVKSILDITATLERLESLSIPVVGYRTRRYPGFYIADTGFELEHSVRDAAEVAAIVAARAELGLPQALLVANPVPVAEQLDPAEHDRVLARARASAERAGVSGKDTTPFLLNALLEATGGRSLEVNVALYRNNVAVAGQIAHAIAG